MRVNGYGSRPGNNGYSGQQRSGDEYNRSYKQVRYTRAEEYATRDVKEYHNYPDQKDLTKEDNEKKKDRSKRNNQSDKAKNTTKGSVQAIQQVAVALVGSAVIAVSYQTAVAKRAEKQVDDTSTSVSSETTQPDAGEEIPAYTATWEWSADNKEAVLILTDVSGKEVARVQATITTQEEEAGCKTAGKRTYTATAEAEGETYTDSREEELPALGHAFDSGTETVLENGETAVDFGCTRCGEHFVIQNSLDEE